jgi:hypothetical protein
VAQVLLVHGGLPQVPRHELGRASRPTGRQQGLTSRGPIRPHRPWHPTLINRTARHNAGALGSHLSL